MIKRLKSCWSFGNQSQVRPSFSPFGDMRWDRGGSLDHPECKDKGGLGKFFWLKFGGGVRRLAGAPQNDCDPLKFAQPCVLWSAGLFLGCLLEKKE